MDWWENLQKNHISKGNQEIRWFPVKIFPTHGKILWPRISASGESLAMDNFSEGEQQVFQEPYRIITDHYLFEGEDISHFHSWPWII
jgi:hypothetical protein